MSCVTHVQPPLMILGGAATLLQMAGKRDWKADVMVLPNSVDKDTVTKLKPERVILFAGKSAREQPSGETLAALQRVPVLRTDETGNVDLVWDGDAVQVKTVG